MPLIRFNHIQQTLRTRSLVIVLSLSAILLTNCKKNIFPPTPASLQIINAVPGSAQLLPDFTNGGQQLFRYTKGIDYQFYNYAASQLSAYTGKQRLRVYQMPDTTSKHQPLFDMNLDLPGGSISTLFLTGTTDAPDTVFRREQLPVLNVRDSVMAIRFMHLSQGNVPISVNRLGEAPGELVSSIAYREDGGFRQYDARGSRQYTFEFRDANTGDLLLTYKFPASNYGAKYLNRCFTIAFAGLPGGTGVKAIKATYIPHVFWL